MDVGYVMVMIGRRCKGADRAAGVYQALAASVVDAQPSAEKRERAASALGGLLTTNGVAANLSRPNRQRFRTNLEAMLRAVTPSGLVLPA